MKKFVFFYIGPALSVGNSSNPLPYSALQQWEQSIGPALAGRGALFGQNGKGVTDTGGVETAPFPMYGFSVVQVEDLDSAVTLAKNHPLLSAGNDGLYEVQIMELFTDDIPAEALAPVADVPTEVIESLPDTMRSQVTPRPQATIPPPMSIAPNFDVNESGPSLPVPGSGETVPPPSQSDELNIRHDYPDDRQ